MTKNDIITGTVTGILGNFAYAFITGLKDESATIMESVLNILKAPIPLWYFLTVLLVVGLLMYACVCVRTYRLSKKALPFLEVTERDYGGFTFQWVWTKNEETGKYEMSDLWPLCPQCHKQLRVELYDPIEGYHCSNGHVYDLHATLDIKRDFLHELQREFKKYADFMTLPDL